MFPQKHKLYLPNFDLNILYLLIIFALFSLTDDFDYF